METGLADQLLADRAAADRFLADGAPGESSEWSERSPAPHLRHVVAGYQGYRTVGSRPRLHRGLPSSALTFIVSIGAPIRVVAHSDPSQPPGAYRVVLAGLHVTHAVIDQPGDGAGIAIELTPLGLRRLVDVPAAALWNRTFECSDVVGSIGDELWDRVNVAPTWAERFDACDDVLGRLLPAAPPPGWRDELDRVWRVLHRSDGAVSVADLAADVGWSRQHLTRQLRHELGIGPKTLAQVIRFGRAVELLRDRGTFRLADVAAECGYADQSHLDRDFNRFAGCPPTRWVAEELDH